jgi:protein-S-isoprenylcysteine O-methyltransferase Ste14
MTFSDFVRAALACYFTFVALFYTAKLLAMRARSGISHAELDSHSRSQTWAHRLFHGFRAVIWSICVTRVFVPEIDTILVPLSIFQHPFEASLGLLLLLLGLFLILYVQEYLGLAWFSGIREEGPQELVSSGPYSVIRHPIFVGITLGQIGFFLALPSIFSLLCLGIGIVVLIIQGRLEEQRMEAAFGQIWRDYAARTPAFLPYSLERHSFKLNRIDALIFCSCIISFHQPMST